jgi:hypothetical protein
MFDHSMEAAHLLTFGEFITALVRIAYTWTSGSPLIQRSSAAHVIPSGGAETVDMSSSSTKPPAFSQLLLGMAQAPTFDTLPAALDHLLASHLTLLATRPDFDRFLEQFHAVPVQRVVQARLAELQTVFAAYSRLFAEDYGMDVLHFARCLKDGAVLSHEFPATAAQELFQNILDHESKVRKNAEDLGVDISAAHINVAALYGTLAVSSPTHQKGGGAGAARPSTVSNIESDVSYGRTRQRAGAPRGAGNTIAASLAANLFRLHNFVQALGVIATLRNPSPFVPLSEKVEASLRAFLDSVRPKVPQQTKARNAGGVSAPVPRQQLLQQSTRRPSRGGLSTE